MKSSAVFANKLFPALINELAQRWAKDVQDV